MAAIRVFAKQVALWALAIAPLAYVVLPLRTYTQAQVEVQDQRGESVRRGTLFLLDAGGTTLERVPFHLPDMPAAAGSRDAPARVRLVADGCEPFEGPLTACREPALRTSNVLDYLEHGGVTYYERVCRPRVALRCQRGP